MDDFSSTIPKYKEQLTQEEIVQVGEAFHSLLQDEAFQYLLAAWKSVSERTASMGIYDNTQPRAYWRGCLDTMSNMIEFPQQMVEAADRIKAQAQDKEAQKDVAARELDHVVFRSGSSLMEE